MLNIFQGARRLALLVAIVATVATVGIFYSEKTSYIYVPPPEYQVNYALSEPNAKLRTSEVACPDKGLKLSFTREITTGKPIVVNICLEPMVFKKDNGEEIELIPYKTDASGMNWGTQRFNDFGFDSPRYPELFYDSKVFSYMKQVEKRFTLSMDDAKAAIAAGDAVFEQKEDKRRKALFSETLVFLGYVVGGLAAFAAVVWAIGWTVRGLLGIPNGMDRRPDFAVPIPPPIAVAPPNIEGDKTPQQLKDAVQARLPSTRPIHLTGNALLLSLAVVFSVISFFVALQTTLEKNVYLHLSDLGLLMDHPAVLREFIAEALGYSFGLPVIHVLLASCFKSMRNSSTRRKIFIGWAIVVITINLVLMAQ